MKCGVGTYTEKLASALVLTGACEVVVLSSRLAQTSESFRGVEVHATVRGWTSSHLFGIVREVLRLKPDFVHLQYPTQAYSEGRAIFWLPILLRLCGLTCVQTWHEPPLGPSGILLALGLKHLISVKRDIKENMLPSARWILRKKKFSWIPSASMLPAIDLSDAQRRETRSKYASDSELLLVTYGFVAPLKGLETLLEVVARTCSKLIMACDLRSEDPYQGSLLRRMERPDLQGRVEIAGFMPERELAVLLGAADAAVFPFTGGAAEWNTSVDGAIAQGTFVLTTTRGESVYRKEQHTFYAQVGAVEEMVMALQQYAGTRFGVKPANSTWDNVAKAHIAAYRELIGQ